MRIYDNTTQLSTTAGTGDFTLSTAVPGYFAFADQLGTGNYFPYLIEAIDGSGVRTGQWEAGIGYYSAADTMQRTVVTDSSDYGSLIDFAAGTKRVSLCYTATLAKPIGCLVYLSGADSSDYTGGVPVPWGSERYDFQPAPFHSASVNPSRINLPDWADRIQLGGRLVISSTGATFNSTTDLWINGAYPGYPLQQVRNANFTGSGTQIIEFHTPEIPNPYGYAEILFNTSASGSQLSPTGSYFYMRVVQ